MVISAKVDFKYFKELTLFLKLTKNINMLLWMRKILESKMKINHLNLNGSISSASEC